MRKIFDQDAPETQLGFKEVQAKAEELLKEVMHQEDRQNTPTFSYSEGKWVDENCDSDVSGATRRLHIHLAENRPLLGHLDQWEIDYEQIDREQTYAQVHAEYLRAEMLREIDTPGPNADVIDAEKRLEEHLIKNRSLLGNQEQWSRDYRLIDGKSVVSSQELGL